MRGPTGTPMSLGHQNQTKKLTHLVDLLGHLLSRNHVSSFSELLLGNYRWMDCRGVYCRGLNFRGVSSRGIDCRGLIVAG